MASLVATPSLLGYVILTSIRSTSRLRSPQQHSIVPFPSPLDWRERVCCACAFASSVKPDRAAVSAHTDI